MSYCKFTKDLDENHLDRQYHDKRYGFPVEEDDELFGRLILEINQAGLSWSLMLKREENFYKAFANFSIQKVAQFDEHDIEELLKDAGIIRNRKKIEAVIYNARQILTLQKEFGSFKNWIDKHNGLSLEEWTKLFKKNFKFTGPLIVEEFLMSTSYLKPAHEKDCEVFNEVLKKKPRWQENI